MRPVDAQMSQAMYAFSQGSSVMARSIRVLGHPGMHPHVVGDVSAMISARDGPASP